MNIVCMFILTLLMVRGMLALLREIQMIDGTIAMDINPISDLPKILQKYGWDGFKHEIVEKGLSKMDAEILETKLIEKY